MLSPHSNFFKEIKKRSGTSLPAWSHFPHNFWRKIFILICSINWPNFIVWLLLLCEVLGNMCIAIVCKPGCDVMNFEVNLTFLIKKEKFKKIFENEIKSISHHFNQANHTIFFGRWEFDFNDKCSCLMF